MRIEVEGERRIFVSSDSVRCQLGYESLAWLSLWLGRRVLQMIPKGGRVLDLCCGAGYESRRVADLGYEAVGVDFSEESVKIARQRNPDLSFYREDMLCDYSYIGVVDAVIVIAGLVHVENGKLPLAFEQMSKVLKKGGKLLMSIREGIGKIEAVNLKERRKGCVSLIMLAFASVYAVYRLIFYYPPKGRPNVYQIPNSNLYRVHKDRMTECINDMEKTACEEVSILSADGLRLCGKLYHMKKDAPLVIFFHGYHGSYAWDGYGFFKICKKNGFNILLIDERAHGKSEGNVITFGIQERYDCKLWAEYAVKRFGECTDIFLAGVSMGAASIMMSSELGLPENVNGIIADCGYSEPAAIIMATIRAMRLPVKPLYQLIKCSAQLFGRFDLESAAPLRAVSQSNIPILFIHGAQDSIVPVSMGEELYRACISKKEKVFIEGDRPYRIFSGCSVVLA